MILGYIKRARNIETYGELLEREKNLILSVLKYQHPDMASKLDELEIGFEFAEPFPDDVDTRWQRISSLFGSGLVSLETAVSMLNLTDNPDEEIDRIMLGAMEDGEKKAPEGDEPANGEGEQTNVEPPKSAEE